MFYKFPVDMTLDEVTAVVNEHNANLGVNAFLRCDKDGYVVFNYFVSFDGTFPPFLPTDTPEEQRKKAILRECRGLTFSPSTGRVIARKYHKFFNVGQKEETQPNAVDWSQPHIILEKLDGSMITPFRPDGSDTIRWGTKMGLTDVAAPVEDFVRKNPRYDVFAKSVTGSTLIFEWCSRKQRIVIDYPDDKLVLTAIRNIVSGEYAPLEALLAAGRSHDIPVVEARPGTVGNIDALIQETADLVNEEGYVIRFENGHMAKLKAREYCLIHGTKDHLQFEKDVLNTIFADKMDDVFPFMDKDDHARVDRFMADLENAIADTAERLCERIDNYVMECDGSRKTFALRFPSMADPFERGLAFSLWDNRSLSEAVEVIKSIIRKNLGSGTRIETVRHLFGGLRWEDYRDQNVVLDD